MSLSPQANHTPVRILLYTVVTEQSQDLPIHRSYPAFVRNRLRRFIDLIRWKVAGKWCGAHWTFEDVHNSNRGDIAIRLGLRQALEQAFSPRTVRFTEVPWGELTPDLLRALEPKIDLIVIGGSGYLHISSAGHLAPRLASDLQTLEAIRCPVITSSIGLNQSLSRGGVVPELQARDRIDLMRFAARLSMISVRDAAAANLFTSHVASPVERVIDPAFLLSKPAPETRINQNKLRVGLNLAFHGPYASSLARKTLPVLVSVLRKIQAIQPCEFYYFAHADSACAMSNALRLKGIKLQLVQGSVQDLLEGYRKLDIHVGSMMHSCILAMSVGVPTMAMAYDIKTAGFFDFFGLGGLCLDQTRLSEESLIQTILDLVRRRREITDIISTRREQHRADAEAYYVRIATLV